VELCEQLLGDFKGQKGDLDSEWAKADKACIATKKSLRGEMKSNKEAMGKLGEAIDRLGAEVAKHREDLVEADGNLKDDELYLKDMTARCEERANDYDQRSAMRGNELTALRDALKILTNDVDSATDVNKRAFVQTPVTTAKTGAKVPTKSVSFLQGVLVKEHARNLLARGRADNSLELEAKKNSALEMLRAEGRRLGSVAIATLAVRMAADPFQKVKGLIQKLVERLLTESKNEASKK